jgi:hypothetical protein
MPDRARMLRPLLRHRTSIVTFRPRTRHPPRRLIPAPPRICRVANPAPGQSQADDVACPRPPARHWRCRNGNGPAGELHAAAAGAPAPDGCSSADSAGQRRSVDQRWRSRGPRLPRRRRGGRADNGLRQGVGQPFSTRRRAEAARRPAVSDLQPPQEVSTLTLTISSHDEHNLVIASATRDLTPRPARRHSTRSTHSPGPERSTNGQGVAHPDTRNAQAERPGRAC